MTGAGYYLQLAVPFILSTVTQPLLGAVDTAVVGKLADPAYIAGVSVGAVIFNTIYWLFGFLRVSTTAYSAQAQGMRSETARAEAFFRPGAFALGLGLVFVLFQEPIFTFSMRLLSPEPDVVQCAGIYYRVLIWGAPLAMLNYVMLGWLMGQARTGVSLLMQIGGNALNIALDLLFVYVYHMDVAGVAVATLLSQLFSFGVGALALAKFGRFGRVSLRKMFQLSSFVQMIRLNADLMLRTLCLLIQINVFTATGASFGTPTLSANAILYQVMMVMSYSFDGLANASSVFAGRAAGGRNVGLLRQTWHNTACWTALLALAMLGVYAACGGAIARLFTDIPAVLELILRYGVWAYVFPVTAWMGVSFYGVFTGLGDTGPIRDSTALSLALFLICWKLLVPIWGNHGLWAAFISFYLGRSLLLLPYYRRTYRRVAEC